MIETIDGEIYAQLSVSDMRLPIQNALTYPEVMSNDYPRLSLADVKSLSFEKMDYNKFPLLELAYDVGKKGNSLPAVLNAANEVCVEKFLKKEINYIDIYHYINKTIESHDIIKNPTFKDIIKTDKWARDFTKENIKIKNKT
jgi:1-deoxy-D-xylulose-5-phosphate reductoisomerase